MTETCNPSFRKSFHIEDVLWPPWYNKNLQHMVPFDVLILKHLLSGSRAMIPGASAFKYKTDKNSFTSLLFNVMVILTKGNPVCSLKEVPRK